jgi:RNA polymerase sigma factor (sigma-70 family)
MFAPPADSPELIDLLATTPSKIPFINRVQELALSTCLEQKVWQLHGKLAASGGSNRTRKQAIHLTADDERELATEVLLLRYQFTELVLHSNKFRQAAPTVIQNIYLFRNRRIFFGTTSTVSAEEERQDALRLFSSPMSSSSLPLAKTFQHLILARVWNRILSTSSAVDVHAQRFNDLHAVVEKLNTIRNIYMLLTTGLVKKLAARINKIYRESVTIDDACQIGSFGIARAAYRYHQSSGIRFSTFAASWVFKEIQRQSLDGRLIRLSANTVEQYARAAKNADGENLEKYLSRIAGATTAGERMLLSEPSTATAGAGPNADPCPAGRNLESRELQETLLQAIDRLLSKKSGDIIKRRYGFPPYQDEEQSVLFISKVYGVTRGSIYQTEQGALKKLRYHLQPGLL